MAEKEVPEQEEPAQDEPVFYHVNGMGDVDGPVGMDRDIWLHFETVKGDITLKLPHKVAAALRRKLETETTIEE